MYGSRGRAENGDDSTNVIGICGNGVSLAGRPSAPVVSEEQWNQRALARLTPNSKDGIGEEKQLSIETSPIQEKALRRLLNADGPTHQLECSTPLTSEAVSQVDRVTDSAKTDSQSNATPIKQDQGTSLIGPATPIGRQTDRDDLIRKDVPPTPSTKPVPPPNILQLARELVGDYLAGLSLTTLRKLKLHWFTGLWLFTTLFLALWSDVLRVRSGEMSTEEQNSLGLRRSMIVMGSLIFSMLLWALVIRLKWNAQMDAQAKGAIYGEPDKEFRLPRITHSITGAIPTVLTLLLLILVSIVYNHSMNGGLSELLIVVLVVSALLAVALHIAWRVPALSLLFALVTTGLLVLVIVAELIETEILLIVMGIFVGVCLAVFVGYIWGATTTQQRQAGMATGLRV